MRILGVAGLSVLGVVLLVCGLDGPGSLGSRLAGLFTGSYMNRSLWLFTAGAVALMSGLCLAYGRRSRPT